MICVAVLQFLFLSSCLLFGKVDFVADATSIKMDYLPIGHARVDPILRDDCLSDHVHTFYGPQSGVDPRRTDSDDKLELHSKLVATDISENTGNAEENKSLYWHPTVYKYNRSTNTYKRDEIAQSSAYYIWETDRTTAFPNGFRMIGGFDVDKSYASAECVNESSCDNGDCYTENDFFPSSKCDELEVSMRMPNCWDGVNIDMPPDHTSHVAYSEDSDFSGDCPASHPIKLPQIQLFFRIMPYDGGWHTFSDDSGVFHADYVSGWDEDFLQEVLDNCENEGEGAMPNFFCENFLTFRDAPKCTDENTCDFSDPNLLKKLKSIQPSTPLDVHGTIVQEETKVIKGDLPRGTCNGSLVGGGGGGGGGGNDNCKNDPDFLYKGNSKQNCDWIEKKGSRFCTKASVLKSCPVSCGVCSNDSDSRCKNNPTYRFNGNSRKNCNWIKAKGKKFCRRQSVFKSCPVSCLVCSDDSVCKDNLKYRHNNNPKMTCEWIKEKRKQLCKKKSVSKSCPVACDVC